ncbi:MAG TPA: DUF4396 domain-containing protein [Solirubrobacteraceae bacterium]|nr:DUF4396 domain-containing protein [Solirubrobacteraceae bacterium]
MPSIWLTVIAWFWLGVAVITSGVLAFDIFVRGHRQPMGVMDAVYPITALYLGPLALVLYWRWARNTSSGATRHQMTGVPEMAMATVGRGTHGPGEPGPGHPARPVAPARPPWVTMAIEVSHCGSGCTIGDVIAELVIYALALTVAGRVLFAEYIGDYLLALAFGIVFQYFAIAPMRGLGLKDGLKAAAKADFISLTFFEIGLFGWMALMAFVFFPAPHHLMPNSAAYWFLMQIGMIAGFVTAWPANVWLLNGGIKVPM